MMISKAHKIGAVNATTPKVIGTHTIEVTTIKVVKLDKKYLPDTIADKSEVETAKTTANNAQTTATNAQNIANTANTTANKAQTTANNAVWYTTSQSLTDVQKQQARTNIGAGTSNFSGNYADLTNAPKILQANWEMYNPDSNAYIANKPFGYEYELEDAMSPANIAELSSGTLDPDSGLYFKRFQHRSYADIDTINPNTGTDLYYFSVNGKSNIVKCYCFKRGRNSTQEYIGIGNASLHALYETSIPMTVYRDGDDWYDVKDTGEDWFLLHEGIFWNFYTTRPDLKITDVHRILSETVNQLDEKFIPDTIARVDNIPQSDWNQNDPEAADYVKNRPFYTGDPVETVLVEESTVPFEDNGGIYIGNFSSTFEATVGETYNVSWDGYEYKCTCVDVDGGHIIGNLSIFGAGPDSGEPFVMAVKDGIDIFIGTAAASTSHTFSISGIVAPIVKIPAKYIDKDASGYIAIHKTNTMTEQEFQNYESAILSRKVVFIIWGGLCISDLGSGQIPDSTGAYVDFISITIINGERYRIVKNSEGVFDLADREISIASFPYNRLTGDRSSGITVVGEKVIISNSMIPSGVGSTSALFKVEPNGMKSKAFEVRGNGEAVTPALILYSSTADSTKKFRVTVDDSGTISATEVT